MNAPHADKKYKEVPGPIEEGDYCVCNFNDCALHFWFKRGQVLQARIVQNRRTTPNVILFEGHGDKDFYANSFTKVETLPKEEKK